MPTVHPTAVLDGDITLADDVRVGPNCVLTGEITLGEGCVLLGSVYLNGPLTMGRRNIVYPFSCLGFAPQHAAFDIHKPGPGLMIGDDNVFRESATIHRAFQDDGPTTVGDHNLLMVNAHIGHDCHVGDHNTLVNNCSLGGHVTVGDKVTIGGATGIHQFCQVGTGAMCSGGVASSLDIPPWFMLTGITLCGSVNLIGMRRNGFTREQIDTVRWVYRTLYRGGHSLKKSTDLLRERADDPTVAMYIQFIEQSKRGIAHGQGQASRGMG